MEYINNKKVAATWGATVFNRGQLPFYGKLTIMGFTSYCFGETLLPAAVCETSTGKEIQLYAWSVRVACEKVFPVLDWEDLLGHKIRIQRKGAGAIIEAIE